MLPGANQGFLTQTVGVKAMPAPAFREQPNRPVRPARRPARRNRNGLTHPRAGERSLTTALLGPTAWTGRGRERAVSLLRVAGRIRNFDSGGGAGGGGSGWFIIGSKHRSRERHPPSKPAQAAPPLNPASPARAPDATLTPLAQPRCVPIALCCKALEARQIGRTRSGRRGRRFKSCHPDSWHKRPLTCGNAR